MPSRQPERNAWNTGTVKKENKQPSSDGDLEVVHREVLMETTGLPERGPGGEPERRGKGTSLGSTHAACGQVTVMVSLGQPSAPVPHLHLRSTSKLWGPSGFKHSPQAALPSGRESQEIPGKWEGSHISHKGPSKERQPSEQLLGQMNAEAPSWRNTFTSIQVFLLTVLTSYAAVRRNHANTSKALGP